MAIKSRKTTEFIIFINSHITVFEKCTRLEMQAAIMELPVAMQRLLTNNFGRHKLHLRNCSTTSLYGEYTLQAQNTKIRDQDYDTEENARDYII